MKWRGGLFLRVVTINLKVLLAFWKSLCERNQMNLAKQQTDGQRVSFYRGMEPANTRDKYKRRMQEVLR